MNSLVSNKASRISETGRFPTHHFTIAAILCAILCTAGCTSADSVAKFSATAQKTVSSGSPIFQDLSGTCAREVADRLPIDQFAINTSITPDCQAVADQTKGIQAASEVLSTYFEALNSLATYNVAQTSTDVGALAATSGQLAGFSSDRQNAVDLVAKLITQITTSSYQTKQLKVDIVNANPHVQLVITALQDSVRGNGLYLDMVARERAALRTRYQEFLRTHPNSPESILILDRQWKTESSNLASKQQSAQAYVAALGLVAKGHASLSEQANKLDAKQLLATLTPYIDQIQPLVAAIQKAF